VIQKSVVHLTGWYDGEKRFSTGYFDRQCFQKRMVFGRVGAAVAAWSVLA
jgi:hypothetical protein